MERALSTGGHTFQSAPLGVDWSLVEPDAEGANENEIHQFPRKSGHCGTEGDVLP